MKKTTHYPVPDEARYNQRRSTSGRPLNRANLGTTKPRPVEPQAKSLTLPQELDSRWREYNAVHPEITLNGLLRRLLHEYLLKQAPIAKATPAFPVGIASVEPEDEA